MLTKRVKRYLLEGIAIAVLIGVALSFALSGFLDAQSVRSLGVNAETGLQEIRVNIPGLPNDAKPLDMVKIPAGTFLMGSPPDERGRNDVKDYGRAWELSQCRATIEREFYLGKYEVTQAQWLSVMGTNPSSYAGHPNRPVEKVSWIDCGEFCNRLSALTGRCPVYEKPLPGEFGPTPAGILSTPTEVSSGFAPVAGPYVLRLVAMLATVDPLPPMPYAEIWKTNPDADGFRMPTSPEWEYACRAGTTTRFSFGDALECDDEEKYCETFDKYMWWSGNKGWSWDRGKRISLAPGTKEVGLKLPNAWGLFDMHGNVSERCNNGPLKFSGDAKVGLVSVPGEPRRVQKGGGWRSPARCCRSGTRFQYRPDNLSSLTGFRVVLACR